MPAPPPHHPKAFHHTPVLPTQASLTLLLFLECTLVSPPSLTFKIPLVSPGPVSSFSNPPAWFERLLKKLPSFGRTAS